jgi:hypothetical protein
MTYIQRLQAIWRSKNDEYMDLMHAIKRVERVIDNMEDEHGDVQTPDEIQVWHEERADALDHLYRLEIQAGDIDEELYELEEKMRKAAFRFELIQFRITH